MYEECFDKWQGGLYGRYFEQEWQSDMDVMINGTEPSQRASWGVGNEVEKPGAGIYAENIADA